MGELGDVGGLGGAGDAGDVGGRRSAGYVAAPFCVVVLLLAGCQWLAAPVTVLVPQLPVAWSALDTELALSYYGRRGRWQTAPHTRYARPGAGVELPLSRQLHTPVLATPYVRVAGRSVALHPAGGIYPHHLDAAGQLHLDWLGGVTATVAAQLWQAGVAADRVDLARVHRALQQRAEGRPWDVDLAAVVDLLRDESFRVTSVRAAPTTEVALTLAAGWWVRADPFADPLRIAAPGPRLAEVALVDGVHLLLRAPTDAGSGSSGGGAVEGVVVQVAGSAAPLVVALGA